MGCCLVVCAAAEEAEPLYRRSIEIRRELLCGRCRRPWQTRGPADVTGELNDLSYLVKHGSSSWPGCWMPRAKRRKPIGCASNSRTISRAVAARLSKPEFQPRRRMLADAAHRPAIHPR